MRKVEFSREGIAEGLAGGVLWEQVDGLERNGAQQGGR